MPKGGLSPNTQRIIAFGFALVLLLMAALTLLGVNRLEAMKQRMSDLVTKGDTTLAASRVGAVARA